MLSHLHSNAYDGAHEYFSLCGTDIPYHPCVAMHILAFFSWNTLYLIKLSTLSKNTELRA